MRAQVLVCFYAVCVLSSGCVLLPEKETKEFALTKQEDEISSAIAHYTMGRIYEHELGEYSFKTIQHLIKTGELDSKAYRKALQNAEKLCREQPESYANRIALARLQHLSGNLKEAIASFQTAMQIEPKNPITYMDLSSLLFFHERDDEAIAVLKSGIELSYMPRIPMDFAYRKGREFLSNSEVPRAAKCFMLVANMSKSHGAELHHMLGELYEKLGFAREAAESYVLAIQDDTPMPNSYLRLAAIQMKSDQEKAMETLLEASKRLPDEPAIQMALGYLYNSRQDIEKAVDSFEKTIMLAEKERSKINLNPVFYLETAAVYELLNRHDKAAEIYKKCIIRFADNDEVLNYIAYTWAEQGINLDQALELSKKSLELAPDNGAYLDTLGWIYYQKKDYEAALKEIRRANELIQDDPTIVEHLGDVFSAMGKDDKALTLWKQSYKIDSTNPAIREKLETFGVDVEKIKEETPE